MANDKKVKDVFGEREAWMPCSQRGPLGISFKDVNSFGGLRVCQIRRGRVKQQAASRHAAAAAAAASATPSRKHTPKDSVTGKGPAERLWSCFVKSQEGNLWACKPGLGAWQGRYAWACAAQCSLHDSAASHCFIAVSVQMDGDVKRDQIGTLIFRYGTGRGD
eukprot:1157256-Pelagomonas_calceolata.AAC.10